MWSKTPRAITRTAGCDTVAKTTLRASCMPSDSDLATPYPTSIAARGVARSAAGSATRPCASSCALVAAAATSCTSVSESTIARNRNGTDVPTTLLPTISDSARHTRGLTSRKPHPPPAGQMRVNMSETMGLVTDGVLSSVAPPMCWNPRRCWWWWWCCCCCCCCCCRWW